MNQQAMTSSDSTGSTDYVEIINSAFNSPVEYMKINDIFREYRNRTLDKINIYGVITYIHKPNRVNSPPQKKGGLNYLLLFFVFFILHLLINCKFEFIKN